MDNMDGIIAWIGSNLNWIQIFSLATGVVYMVMQIFQHKLMWYFNLLMASSALVVAMYNHIWAQTLLNVYFIAMALVGIFRWRNLSEAAGDGKIHLVRLSPKIIIIAIQIIMVGAPILCTILYFTNDPSPIADGISMCLSIVAAWFLTRSHIEQYLLWVAADLLSIVVYAGTGAWWMVGLYYCFIISSFFGIKQWYTNGVYVEGKK